MFLKNSIVWSFQIDATELAKKQLNELQAILTKIPNQNEIDEILSKHSDTMCDYCKKPLNPSFEDAVYHYKKVHNKDGYIKCCDVLLKSIEEVKGHVMCHIYSTHFT